MSSDIVFWGASGHARVLRELVEPQGYRLVALFDNDPSAKSPFADVPIHHGEAGFRAWCGARGAAATACLVAVGGARGQDRVALQQRMSQAGLTPISIAHRTAFVAADAVLGAGSQALAQAAVCAAVRIGRACIVNTRASIDHECRLEDGVHVAPGATLAGCVQVGRYSLIGAGAVVLPRIRVGANVIVGAGAVVTRDIPDDVVAYGNPARPAGSRGTSA